ncbi:MAG TPA: nuclear transport factor 2 family protein [Candidatus Baltobacteraceae bacterium]|nr:nuclear transport factor 2 family protein [Candidatus Baltobacteraceae bacterium]
MSPVLAALLVAALDPHSAVLATESRWVHAAYARDPAALARILAPDFVHTTYRGDVRNRSAELRLVTQPKPFEEHTSGQTVDVLGTVAVVHGLNTITEGGKIVLRLRYTDVYELREGRWMAVSAQETAVSPEGTH